MVAAKPRRKIPWYRRVVYSLLPTLIILSAFEFGLRLAGFQSLSSTEDPLVGFAAVNPLFEPVGGMPKLMVTSPNKRVWFNEQVFLKTKPAGMRRVFCVGGSTTYGRPYSDATSYCGWLRKLLPKLTGQDWEVINAGGVSYASYRNASLMQELARYEPDLFIVYSAHNEFLERRTYAGLFARPSWLRNTQGLLEKSCLASLMVRWLNAGSHNGLANESQSKTSEDQSGASGQVAAGVDRLPAEVDERLNHTLGPTDYTRDVAWAEKVLVHYRLNIQRMVDMARDCGAEIVLITPASNESDCSPFKSELATGLMMADQNAFAMALDTARQAAAESTWETAIASYQSALQLDPRHPHASFGLGRALAEVGRFSEAQTAFSRAIDEDICPLRATTEISDIVREVARAKHVPLVEFERNLRRFAEQKTGRPILGEQQFLDHVHPTLDVHRELALWIVATLQRENFVSGLSVVEPSANSWIEEVGQEIEAGIDQTEHGVALRNLAKVLHWSGKYAEALPRASDALELLPGDLESRFVMADCLANTGERQRALDQYELLFQDGEFPRAFLPFTELLVETGDYERARAYGLLGVLVWPGNPYAYLLLGKVHIELDEFDLAIEALGQAQRLAPDEVMARELLQFAKERRVAAP